MFLSEWLSLSQWASEVMMGTWRMGTRGHMQDRAAQSGHLGHDFAPHPISQIGITMLVSVENLEEAGEHVSFWLQIRRY